MAAADAMVFTVAFPVSRTEKQQRRQCLKLARQNWSFYLTTHLIFNANRGFLTFSCIITARALVPGILTRMVKQIFFSNQGDNKIVPGTKAGWVKDATAAAAILGWRMEHRCVCWISITTGCWIFMFAKVGHYKSLHEKTSYWFCQGIDAKGIPPL